MKATRAMSAINIKDMKKNKPNKNEFIIRCITCGMPYDVRKYEYCPACWEDGYTDNYGADILDTDAFGNCFSDADPGY